MIATTVPKNSFRHPVRDSIAAQLKAHEMAELSLAQVVLADTGDSSPPSVWFAETGKVYARLPKVALPPATECLDGEVASVLGCRRSVREFSPQCAVPLAALSRVMTTGFSGRDEHRPFASAGARYPTEVYIVANYVDGLSPGLFHFDPKGRELARLVDGHLDQFMKEAIGDEAISTPSFYLVLTSVLHRSMVKYSGRAYRFALIEIGAAAQAIQMVCQVEGLSSVWIGGFADGALRELLDINWEMELETPMLIMAVGIPGDIEAIYA